MKMMYVQTVIVLVEPANYMKKKISVEIAFLDTLLLLFLILILLDALLVTLTSVKNVIGTEFVTNVMKVMFYKIIRV